MFGHPQSVKWGKGSSGSVNGIPIYVPKYRSWDGVSLVKVVLQLCTVDGKVNSSCWIHGYLGTIHFAMPTFILVSSPREGWGIGSDK